MNQGKIIVGIAITLGICAGLAGYWWNYGVSRRAMEFWGQENARLIRLAPKVEYLELEKKYEHIIGATPDDFHSLETKSSYEIRKTVDLSEARGLIHLRNAILSDDQYDWNKIHEFIGAKLIALRFTDESGKETTIYFTNEPPIHAAFQDINKQSNSVTLGPLAKSLEQFLARELPRAEQEAAATNKQELAPQ